MLPFKLEETKDLITSQAGLALLGEFAEGLMLDNSMPGPGNEVGYLPIEYFLPLILMLNGGGRRLEDLRQIRTDQNLRDALQLNRLPLSDATGDWMRASAGKRGLDGLGKVNRRLLKRGLKCDRIENDILDIDTTGIGALKRSVKMTCKGFTGCMPMVGHLAENGLVVGDVFHQGNESPESKNLELIEYCELQLPEGKRIVVFRSDSAAYQADVINYCERNRIEFAIEKDMDEAVVRVIQGIGGQNWLSWTRLKKRSDWWSCAGPIRAAYLMKRRQLKSTPLLRPTGWRVPNNSFTGALRAASAARIGLKSLL